MVREPAGHPEARAERSTGPFARTAAVAVIFGSGLAVLPLGATVEDEVAYADLGWPLLGVEGHAGRLLVASTPAGPVLLAFGRPHRYEGWSEDELRRPVADLAAWGVRRLLITNACGGLSERAAPGTLVVVDDVVDLQAAPPDEPEVLPASDAAWAGRCAERLAAWFPVLRGRYVAVPGPQYETPAEAGWLAGYGDVVGMSTAPEVRAAREHGLETVVLALVVNRSAASLGHDEVLGTAAGAADRLAQALPAVLA